MFFFIGGVEERPTLIDEGPYRCPNCGAEDAVVFRMDRYITFFFIPIFPISRGRAMLRCKACGYAEDDRTAALRQSGGLPGGGVSGGTVTGGGDTSGRLQGRPGGDFGGGQASRADGPASRGGVPGESAPRACPHCSARVSAEYRYCPYCGTKLGG